MSEQGSTPSSPDPTTDRHWDRHPAITRLADDSRVTIRPIGPADAPLLAAGFSDREDAGPTLRELLRAVAVGLLAPANALLQREPPGDG